MTKIGPVLLVVLLAAVLPTACQRRGGEVLVTPVRAAAITPERAATSSLAARTKPAGQATPEISNRAPLKLPLTRPRLLVLKARRQLILFEGDKAVRLYPVGLGTNPTGDKEQEGDRRTPEGDFYVCVKNAQSAYYLSLGLSYPNEEDAARGLRDRLITRAQYERIIGALKRKRTPPWNTQLGGEIFIHGNGAQSDWTWGCVALENSDMKELFDAVPRGTPVRIEP